MPFKNKLIWNGATASVKMRILSYQKILEQNNAAVHERTRPVIAKLEIAVILRSCHLLVSS